MCSTVSVKDTQKDVVSEVLFWRDGEWPLSASVEAVEQLTDTWRIWASRWFLSTTRPSDSAQTRLMFGVFVSHGSVYFTEGNCKTFCFWNVRIFGFFATFDETVK